MKRFENPIKTEIQYDFKEGSDIAIVGETEKAYLVVITTTVRRGTSKINDYKEREQWIPKSVWDNDKNFETYNYMGGDLEVTTFKPPYFLR